MGWTLKEPHTCRTYVTKWRTVRPDSYNCKVLETYVTEEGRPFVAKPHAIEGYQSLKQVDGVLRAPSLTKT